jgi:hypothetical protein
MLSLSLDGKVTGAAACSRRDRFGAKFEYLVKLLINASVVEGAKFLGLPI